VLIVVVGLVRRSEWPSATGARSVPARVPLIGASSSRGRSSAQVNIGFRYALPACRCSARRRGARNAGRRSARPRSRQRSARGTSVLALVPELPVLPESTGLGTRRVSRAGRLEPRLGTRPPRAARLRRKQRIRRVYLGASGRCAGNLQVVPSRLPRCPVAIPRRARPKLAVISATNLAGAPQPAVHELRDRRSRRPRAHDVRYPRRTSSRRSPGASTPDRCGGQEAHAEHAEPRRGRTAAVVQRTDGRRTQSREDQGGERQRIAPAVGPHRERAAGARSRSHSRGGSRQVRGTVKLRPGPRRPAPPRVPRKHQAQNLNDGAQRTVVACRVDVERRAGAHRGRSTRQTPAGDGRS
jgi:hypothetical protein